MTLYKTSSKYIRQSDTSAGDRIAHDLEMDQSYLFVL